MEVFESRIFNPIVAKALWPDAKFYKNSDAFSDVTFEKEDGVAKFTICSGRTTQETFDVLINCPNPYDLVEYNGHYHTFCKVEKVTYHEIADYIDFQNEHRQTLRIFKNGNFSLWI